MTDFRVRGLDAATGRPVDLWISGGRFVDGPLSGAALLTGWALPGFVDAHCHVGYSATGTATLDEAEQQARTNLAAGALALRDCGSPLDTRPLVGRDDLPVLVRAGRHIARTKRYIRELGVEVEPADLASEVARQLEYGGGWIKIVGDWIDRGIGDLAPLWPDDILTEAIAVAHAGGARVTTHVFGEDALPGLLGGRDRLHRARHRADRRHHRHRRGTWSAPGADGDQHRQLSVLRRRRRAASARAAGFRPARAGPAPDPGPSAPRPRPSAPRAAHCPTP